MKNFPTIKPYNIISHKEACARGYASNHGDPENWLSKFGKDMDWFRRLVEHGGVEVERYAVTGTKTVVGTAALKTTQNQLMALGFEISANRL